MLRDGNRHKDELLFGHSEERGHCVVTAVDSHHPLHCVEAAGFRVTSLPGAGPQLQERDLCQGERLSPESYLFRAGPLTPVSLNQT